MTDKEFCEFIDALARDSRDALPPYKELEMFGLDPFGRPLKREARERCENYWELEEEYEFDETDERYSMLAMVLRMNNDRKKYYA